MLYLWCQRKPSLPSLATWLFLLFFILSEMHVFQCADYLSVCRAYWKIHILSHMIFSSTSSYLIGSQTCNLLAYSIIPQPLHYHMPQSRPSKKNSVALSPQANYTDWATATCRRNLVPTFADSGVLHGQRGGSPTVFNLSFLDRRRYFSFK
jgi:hypothetical protein